MPTAIAYEDAVDLLDGDHKLVQKLFIQYETLREFGAPAADRWMLAERICAEIAVYAQIEEEIFYPAVREADPVSHELPLEQAPEGYENFDKRKDGWTKMVLSPAVDGGGRVATRCRCAPPEPSASLARPLPAARARTAGCRPRGARARRSG